VERLHEAYNNEMNGLTRNLEEEKFRMKEELMNK
jgi:hypothetical protein